MKKRKRPNLVFVFADQLGRNHCGFAGAKQAETPNMDALARDGVNFTNAVSTMPVCSAYRASLLTGKYPTSTGMVINEIRMNPSHECLGHVLTRGGYETGYIGKWHLYANELGNHNDPKNSHIPPGPHRLGFDGYWAAFNFHHVYYDTYYHEDTADRIWYGDGVYEPNAQTDMAIRFLESAANSSSPFALFVSYGTPHDPWTDENVPEEYRACFDNISLPNSPNYREENDPHADYWGVFGPGERPHLEAWRRNYYAMATNLDWNIGRLIAALRGTGLANDTILVFTSDHGEMFGAHGRRAKNIFYEEAARIPFLMSWPGNIPAGSVSDACLSTVDIMPTLLSMMDLPIPAAVEGMDLGHCALGLPGNEPQAAFLQNTGSCADWIDGHEWRAIRDKRFTYAIYRVDSSELMFDNVNDPYQLTDLADNTDYADTTADFRRILADKMTSLNDTFESCTWYRDNWTDDRIIIRSATMG